MPPRKSSPPRFLIIAGPNGSGKSTAYEQSVVELRGRAFRIINPDLRSRHKRSLAQLPWFFTQSDLALIYDNSGASPRLIGQKKDDVSWVDVGAPDDLLSALL